MLEFLANLNGFSQIIKYNFSTILKLGYEPSLKLSISRIIH